MSHGGAHLIITGTGAAVSDDVAIGIGSGAMSAAGHIPTLSVPSDAIFEMDYSSSADPLAGWPSLADVDGHEGIYFNQDRVAGAGPLGRDVQRIAHIPGFSDVGIQFNVGWRGSVEASAPAYGTDRYYRWYMKFSSDTNFRGAGGGNHTNKFLIIGQGCTGGSCRCILNLTSSRSTVKFGFYWGIDGGGGESDPSFTGLIYDPGTWYAVQVRIRHSTADGAGNGRMSIWINNDTAGSPTSETAAMEIKTTLHHQPWLGGFANQATETGGVNTWDLSRFQVDDTFDSSWHADME